MENGLNEVHLSSEVKSLKISGTVCLSSNGSASLDRTRSPAKRCRELLFIDDGIGFSSTSLKNQENYVPEDSDQLIEIFHDCTTKSSTSLPSPPPAQSDVCEMTTSSRRLPTVVVLGYQRVVAESQAAAERMNQQQQQFLRQNTQAADSPLTPSTGSSEPFDSSLPSSSQGLNNRVNCPPSDDINRYAKIPASQSSPTDAPVNANTSPPTKPSALPLPPIADQETKPSCESSTISPICSSLLDAGSILSSRPVSEDAESIAESVYHQPPKAADRSAAYRLARRLFTLDGFKITDVAKHLCKRNDFSQLVSEEFTSFFDFTDQTIDTALRYFMTKFALTGETQDRERILFHFSRRYVTCNPNAFVSDDACHALVCALMLLNTDLHNQNITRKMSSQEFVDNLMDLNTGENGFSPDELKRLYDAFKQEPLRCPVTEVPTFNLLYGIPPAVSMPPGLTAAPGVYGFGMNCLPTPTDIGIMGPPTSSAAASDISSNFPAGSCVAAFGQSVPPYWQTVDPSLLAAWTVVSDNGSGNYLRPALLPPHQATLINSPRIGAANSTDGGVDLLKQLNNINSYPDMPKDVSAMKFMRGFVMRKCLMQSHRKRTAKGKRGWKLFYARLRDLALYFYKDEETAAAAARAEDLALSYMKQVYRFQHHCQQLRFFHEHQQRLQASLIPSTPLTNNSSFEGASSSSVTENFESVLNMVEEKAETEEGLEKLGKDALTQSHSSPQTTSQMTALNTPPTMSSVLEQQLNSAAFQLPPPPPPPPPECVVCIAHAFAFVEEGYVKKPNVFCLKTKDGSEFLMQVDDAKELEQWVDRINYVAGLLSAPPLPSAVGSDQTFHRPILPSGVTHLGISDQLESHKNRIKELTRDLTELKCRRMSAPSQPNLTCLPRDPVALSPAPSIQSESAAEVMGVESEVPQLHHPLSNQLPYIPDSVLKSLPPSSTTTLPSSTAHQLERSFPSAFSTASLGRRRKKSFNAFRGGTGSELTAQRARLDEQLAFLEYEITRYRTYSRLMDIELGRLQRLSPPKTPSSPQPVYNASSQVRGFWQVCGPGYLLEEPSGSDGDAEGWRPAPVIASLPPQAKRGYSASRVFGSSGGMRQSRPNRTQYRHYQMYRRQQQQLYNHTPSSTSVAYRREEETAPAIVKGRNASLEQDKLPTAFYEVL